MSPSEMSEAMNAVSSAASDPGTFDPTASGNDPLSYFDPVTESYFPGAAPGSGGADRDYGTDFSTSPGMLVRERTTPALIQEMIDAQYYKDLSDRISANRVGGRESYAYGMEDFPVGRVPSFGMPEEEGLLGGARPSYAAPTTTPTSDSLGFLDRYSRPEYDYVVPNVTENTSGKAQLESIVANGFGGMKGLNPNNPDQTAQQLLNSFRANDFLTEYAPSLFTAGLPPGMAFAFNALRSGADIAAGRTTPGQALVGVGLDALASKLGIPGGGPVLGNLLEGRVGPAAGGAAAGVATGALARAGLGALAPIVAKETGLSSAISKGVSGAVQPQPGQGTGFVSSITDAINRGAQGIMGLFGGTPAAPIPEASKVTTPTRAYVPSDSNLYESGGYEPPVAATAPTTPAVTTPEVAATRRLLYGTAQGPYGPLLAYDFGEA